MSSESKKADSVFLSILSAKQKQKQFSVKAETHGAEKDWIPVKATALESSDGRTRVGWNKSEA